MTGAFVLRRYSRFVSGAIRESCDGLIYLETNWKKIALERVKKITELEVDNVVLKNAIATLQVRISDLKERLGLNSSNSSIPPSSEGLLKPPVTNRSDRRNKLRNKKTAWAEGKHLAQVIAPDEVVVHRPDEFDSCGGDPKSGKVVDIETRQVFEPPKMAAHAIEHQLLKVVCTCDSETKTLPPPESYSTNLLCNR